MTASTRRSFWAKLLLWLGSIWLVCGACAVLAGLTVRAVWVHLWWKKLQPVEARIERKWGPLDPATLVRPSVPDAENQAVLFKAAAEGAAFTKEEKAVLDCPAIKEDKPPTPAEFEALGTLVSRKAAYLAMADEAARRPRSDWKIDYAAGQEVNPPNLIALIYLARLLRARALLEIRVGETDAAIQSLDVQFALAASLAKEPWTLVQVHRKVYTRMACRTLEDLLQRRGLDRRRLDRLCHSFERLPRERAAPLAFVGEVKMAHKTIIDIEKTPVNAPLGGIPYRVLWWTMRMAAYESRRLYLVRAELFLSDVARPRFQRHDDWIENPEPNSWIGESDPFKDSFTSFPTMLEGFDLDEARQELARTALALERYRAVRGRFPGALADLVPEFLAAPPIDPFTGREPEYRIRERTVIVRSAGSSPRYPDGTFKGDKMLEWTLAR